MTINSCTGIAIPERQYLGMVLSLRIKKEILKKLPWDLDTCII